MKATVPMLVFLMLLLCAPSVLAQKGSGPVRAVRETMTKPTKRPTPNTSSLQKSLSRSSRQPNSALSRSFENASQGKSSSTTRAASKREPSTTRRFNRAASAPKRSTPSSNLAFNRASDSKTGKEIHRRSDLLKKAHRKAGLEEAESWSRLRAVNLQKPVKVKRARKGTREYQYLHPGSSDPGRYTTPSKAATPSVLGISGEGRKKIQVETTKDSIYIESTASPTPDNFTNPNKVVHTKGGAIQHFYLNPKNLKKVPDKRE